MKTISSIHWNARKLSFWTMLALTFLSFAMATMQAQTHLPPCFCCGDSIYQFPTTPFPINGPSPICPCSTSTFTTTPCPGATITWTVADNLGNTIAFTGQSTSAITLTPPLNKNATSVTIKVVIKCGNIVKQNSITVPIKKPKACFAWSVIADGSGGYTVTGTGDPSATGLGSAWRFTEIVNPKDCATSWGYGPSGGSTGCPPIGCCNSIKEGPGANFIWNSAGACTLLPGKTYRLIHWVEKCSATWLASDCRALCWICFTIDTSGERRSGNLAKGTKVRLINVFDGTQVDDPKPEMLKGLQR